MRFLSAALRVFFNPSFRCVRKIVGPTEGLFEFETRIDEVMVNADDSRLFQGWSALRT